MKRSTLAALFTFLLVFSWSCGEIENGDDHNGDDHNGDLYSWQCDEEHNGWERCRDNRIEYCHAVDGMSPHFHWGSNCEDWDMICTVLDEHGNAVCIDESIHCTDEDNRCEDNTAYFCVEGHMAVKPCGTANHCHLHDGMPECEPRTLECGGHGHMHDGECHCDEGYTQDPDDPSNCIAVMGFGEVSCELFRMAPSGVDPVTEFAQFPDAYVDLETPYSISLSDTDEIYVHFPVTRSGHYVVFLSRVDVLASVMHRDATDLRSELSGGSPGGRCPELILQHWHIDLEMDGDEGADRVPYILAFEPVEGGADITFMVRYKPE